MALGWARDNYLPSYSHNKQRGRGKGDVSGDLLAFGFCDCTFEVFFA